MVRPIIIIAGPTAAGKSSLALILAEQFGGHIVNADSMQIYHESRILSARPLPENMHRVPHFLYGHLSIRQFCSVGLWLRLMEDHLHQAQTSLPTGPLFMVGGTGLYLQALTQGLAVIPPVSESDRQEAENLWIELGAAGFYRRLQQIDPLMAQRLHPNDRQRLIRAFSVYLSTGRSLWHWWNNPHRPLAQKWLAFTLIPERTLLYQACDQRFLQMIKQGALEEAKSIYDMQLPPQSPGLGILGLRRLFKYFDGTITLEQALALSQQDTRNYAKRQITWFGRQFPAARRLEPDIGNLSSLTLTIDLMTKQIKQFLDSSD